MSNYTPAWPHGPIQEVFKDIFMVTGTNKTAHDGFDYQFSRNMIIVREGSDLSLINTVRLTEEGLKELEKLGQVKNIIRLGAFHGRDDQFYLDRYQASFWGPKDVAEDLPLTAKLFKFDSEKFNEAALLIERHDSILVTCDSIQNWAFTDQFFNDQTRIKFFKEGKIRSANIGDPWKHAVRPQNMHDLLKLDFKHLLSAHGAPMFDKAYLLIKESLRQEYEYKTPEKNLLYEDEARKRRIPVVLYGENKTKGLVIISHGHMVNHARYRFLARHFIEKGYMVASIQHEIEGDGELPVLCKRQDNWQQGVESINYVKDQLAKTYSQVKADKVILIGHSNGGDMSICFGHKYPEKVSHIITLDSLRATMRENAPYKVMTLRATDTYADPTLLPHKDVKIVQVHGEHNELYDKGSDNLKAEILEHIQFFLG